MASFDFPLQFKRQYEGPMDFHAEFATTAERTSFLTDGRRYAGMVVYDKQTGRLYILNSAKNAWLEVPTSSNSSEIRLTAGELTVDNIKIDGNTISSSAGDIILTPNGSDVIPGSDAGANLGTSTIEWNDLWIDGTANIDSLVADTADINGGSIDGITIGTNSVATEIRVDDLTLNGNVISSTGDIVLSPTGSDVVPGSDAGANLGTSTIEWNNLWIDGTANIDSLVADTADINAGTIDGVTIGTNSVATDIRVDQIRLDSNIVSTIGANNLVLNTNGGTDSGTITIAQGASADITITPNNAGNIILDGQLWPQTVGATGTILGVTNNATGQLGWVSIGAGGGVGDVSFTGTVPVDNAIARYDQTTGKLIQASGVTIDDNNIVSGITQLNVDNIRIDGNTISSSSGDIVLSPTGSDVVPGSDAGANLGTSSVEWNDLWVDGTANIDSLVADTADINAGTIDGVTIGTNSVATEIRVDNLTLNGNIISSTTDIVLSPTGSDVVPGSDAGANLGTSSVEWNDLWIDGTANIDSLVADTADINGGTIDGVTIGTSSPATSIAVGLLSLASSKISATSIDGSITLEPNGIGKVYVNGDALVVGKLNSPATITTFGGGSLTINTFDGTNSGSIVIGNGSNADISITPDGVGNILLDGQKWPQADGTVNQNLKTNGAGQLFWSSIGNTVFNYVSAEETPTLYYNELSGFGANRSIFNLEANSKYRITCAFGFAYDSLPRLVLSGNNSFNYIPSNTFAFIEDIFNTEIGTGGYPTGANLVLLTKDSPLTIVIGFTGSSENKHVGTFTAGSNIEVRNM